MVDLLQPEQIRKWGYYHDASERTPEEELLHRLCRDYLTLWERVEELEELNLNWEQAFAELNLTDTKRSE